MSIETFIFMCLGFLIIFFSGLIWVLATVVQAQKTATLLSHLATIAAFRAVSSAESVKGSTIIQRIVEKYSPTQPSQAESIKRLEEEFESLYNPEAIAERRKKNKESSDWNGFTEDIDPLISAKEDDDGTTRF